MSGRIAEFVAVLTTVVGSALATFGPFFHEKSAAKSAAPPGATIVTLTGVAATGTWTEEDVKATNYWSRSFAPARPVLHAGHPALFRLKSADVVHTFYCPALRVGPVDVYPGHVAEVAVTPGKEGVFDYYCTTVCGDPHFGMRGQVVVQGDDGPAPEAAASSVERYWLESLAPESSSRVERGKQLYYRMGCFTCHGPEGRGGVRNWNYVKDTVPALNTLAERLMLFEPEDVEVVVEEMERGVDLKSLLDDPPVPRFNVVLAQYNSVRDVVRRGNPAGKKDPEGPAPPLEMPAWGQRLTDAEIDCVIAYLLTLQPWEDEGDEEENGGEGSEESREQDDTEDEP